MATLTPEEIQALEHTFLGPTWARNEVGDWILPDRTHTLGWQIAAWCSEYMLAEEGGSWRFTLEQLRFVLWWYAVDERGRFINRKGVLQRMKGWGKDPLLAVLCLVELCGPAKFSHFNEAGQAVGRSHPRALVQVTAVNQTQPLALDTRVPTPSGYVTVADLGVGDIVFDEHGEPQVVARETEVFNDLDCYRLTFDDGTSIISSASHAWTLDQKTSHGDRYERVTLTTAELVDGYQDSLGRTRVRIPLAPRLSAPVELPVDPYVLGMWLGDGTAQNGSIAVGDQDLEATVENLRKCLLPHEDLSIARGTGVWMVNIIRRKDLCPRGHDRSAIPARQNGAFPRCGSCLAEDGRLKRDGEPRSPKCEALIQRLRDIGVLGNKHIPSEYLLAGTDQRRALIQGLVDSDGHVTAEGQVIFTNTNWSLIQGFKELSESLGMKVHVRAHSTVGWIASTRPVDELPMARLERKASRQKITSRPYRYLHNVEAVDSVPVKCIGLDTDSHLFQVESGVVTHNTGNTMDFIPGLISDRMRAEYDIKDGAEIIRANRGRQKLVAVTSSYRALEGKRTTFTLLNETHHWVLGNQGHKMYETIDGNAKKMDARYLAITNAYEPGEDSVAERMREAWNKIQEGRAHDIGFLYDSVEAHPNTPLTPDAIRRVIPIIRGDAVWLNPESVLESVLDTSIPASRSRRMWLNQIVATEEALYGPEQWKPLEDPELTLRTGDEIVLGFDGGKSDDSTALVALRISDLAVFILCLEERDDHPDNEDWQVDKQKVDSAVHEAFRLHKVRGFYADVALWESHIDDWAETYREVLSVKASERHAIAWDMRRSLERVTRAHERLVQGVLDGKLKHDGDKRLLRHVMNVRRHTNNYGVSFRKESRESPKKIDVYAALLLAHEALHDLRTRGVKAKAEKTRNVVFY